MHAEFAAGFEQTIDDEQPQHFFPTHRFTTFWQTLLPELIKTQLLPEITGQPATAEHPGTLQFESAQPHLQLSMASTGTSRSSGNRLSEVKRCSASSNTSS